MAGQGPNSSVRHTVIWGPPKCGKSFWATDLCLHVALAGLPRPTGQAGAGGVLRDGGRVRLRPAHGGVPPAAATRRSGSVPFYLVSSPMALVRDHPALIASIRVTLGDTPPRIVVIDTLNRSLAGSESDDRDMAAYIAAADAIREAFNCAVIIIHHCGIEGTRPRGHSSLTGAVAAQLAANRDAAGNVVVTVEYMRDGPDDITIVSRLEPVEVGLDEDGEPITSCVVVPVEDAPVVARQADGRRRSSYTIALCARRSTTSDRTRCRLSTARPSGPSTASTCAPSSSASTPWTATPTQRRGMH